MLRFYSMYLFVIKGISNFSIDGYDIFDIKFPLGFYSSVISHLFSCSRVEAQEPAHSID